MEKDQGYGVLGVSAFFIGVIFIGAVDMIIPKGKNPHHFKLSSAGGGPIVT